MAGEMRRRLDDAPHVEGKVERSRIRLLTGGLAFAVSIATGRGTRAGSAPLPAVTVYKSPT